MTKVEVIKIKRNKPTVIRVFDDVYILSPNHKEDKDK